MTVTGSCGGPLLDEAERRYWHSMARNRRAASRHSRPREDPPLGCFLPFDCVKCFWPRRDGYVWPRALGTAEFVRVGAGGGAVSVCCWWG